MIVDKLKNIDLYRNLSEDIYSGLKFISDADKNISLGNYQIAKNVKAIVSSYETVDNFERGYESHKNVIDIQYPVVGLERVKWSPIDQMTINIPYDIKKDSSVFSVPPWAAPSCCGARAG